MSLPHRTEELEEAVLFLACHVQAEVIKAVHGAWPRCPRHPHSLELEGGVAWVCRIDQVTVAQVGKLGG